MSLDQRINDRADAQTEQAQLRQTAQAQEEQRLIYQATRQTWKTIRQGTKWVRVLVEAPAGGPPWRTVQQDGRWVRVPA